MTLLVVSLRMEENRMNRRMIFPTFILLLQPWRGTKVSLLRVNESLLLLYCWSRMQLLTILVKRDRVSTQATSLEAKLLNLETKDQRNHPSVKPRKEQARLSLNCFNSSLVLFSTSLQNWSLIWTGFIFRLKMQCTPLKWIKNPRANKVLHILRSFPIIFLPMPRKGMLGGWNSRGKNQNTWFFVLRVNPNMNTRKRLKKKRRFQWIPPLRPRSHLCWLGTALISFCLHPQKIKIPRRIIKRVRHQAVKSRSQH